MDDAATDWRALTRAEKKDIWTFEPKRRRSPSVLTPSAASSNRAANGGGCDLIDVETGEVLIDIETGEVLSTGCRVGDLGHGRVGQIRPLSDNTPDDPRPHEGGVLLPVTRAGV